MAEDIEVANKRRKDEHGAFSEAVICFLMKNSGLSVTLERSCRNFTNNTGEAILVFSNIFHKDFRKIFHQLHLSDSKRFKAYFRAFPLNEDASYFYYYLMWISLMYELAVYSYIEDHGKKDYRYFEVVRGCVSECPDMLYFENAGGWSRLHKTASFLVDIGLPMKLIMNQNYVEDRKILTFPHVFKKILRKYKFPGNAVLLNVKALDCLKALNDEYMKNMRTRSKKGERCTLPPKSSNVAKREEDIIKTYVECCRLKALPQDSSAQEPQMAGEGSSLRDDDAVAAEVLQQYCSELESLMASEESSSPDDEPVAADPVQNPERNESEESSLTSEESDEEIPLFVVPRKYLLYLDSPNECELYWAHMDPPSKRKKLGESLRTLLNRSILDRSYNDLGTGDLFVLPRGSSGHNILVVFLDDSSDDEISEDTYRFLCHFKKVDLDFYDRDSSLRSRKRAYDKSVGSEDLSRKKELKKLEKRVTGVSRISSRKMLKYKILVRDEVTYAKYLAKIYKAYLPTIIDECLAVLTPDNESDESISSSSSNSRNITKGNIPSFIITSRLLLERRNQLSEGKSEVIVGISIHEPRFGPIVLPLDQRGLLDLFIEKMSYHDMEGGVYLVGNTEIFHYNKMEIWFLFSPLDQTQHLGAQTHEWLNNFESYVERMTCFEKFASVNEDHLGSLHTTLNKVFSLSVDPTRRGINFDAFQT